MFKLQTRNASGKWTDLRFAGPPHSHIETAISAACHLDQDGIFPGDCRIVSADDKPVVTAKSWFDQFRAAGMQPFRYE